MSELHVTRDGHLIVISPYAEDGTFIYLVSGIAEMPYYTPYFIFETIIEIK